MRNTKAWEDNPRDSDPKRIAGIEASMARFGPLEGIIVNIRDGDRVLVGGHQRIGIMPDDITPVIEERLDKPTETGTVATGYVIHEGERYAYREVDWDVETHEAAGIAANQHGADGFMRTKLYPMLNRSLISFDKEVLGFPYRELANAREFGMRGSTEGGKELVVPDEPDATPGEIYEIEGTRGQIHKIACGDSGDNNLIEWLCEDVEPSICIADPPYAVGHDPDWQARRFGKGQRRKGYADPDDAHADFSNVYLNVPDSIGIMYVWHSGIRSITQLAPLLDMGWEPRFQFIWHKEGGRAFTRGRVRYLHEPCMAFRRKGRKDGWLTEGARTSPEPSVWTWKQPTDQSLGHGATKPVEAYRRPMELHVEPYSDSYAYTPFAGSGTCMIAADQHGIASLCVEIDPHFVDIAMARFQAYKRESVSPTGRKEEQDG